VTLLVAIGGIAALVLLLVLLVPSRIKVAGPRPGVPGHRPAGGDGRQRLRAAGGAGANVARGLQPPGDLTGRDVGAVLRRLGKGVTEDGGAPAATRVQLDGDGAQPRS
jgi:flotillin